MYFNGNAVFLRKISTLATVPAYAASLDTSSGISDIEELDPWPC